MGLGKILILDPADASANLANPVVSGGGTLGEAGLAFDAAGLLFGSRGASIGRNEDLVRINTTTAVRTGIGPATHIISDIWFAADGTLYGASPHGVLGSPFSF